MPPKTILDTDILSALDNADLLYFEGLYGMGEMEVSSDATTNLHG